MVPGFLRYFTRAKPAEGQPWAALALARAGVARPWPWPGLGVAQPWAALALARAGQGQPWPWPGLGVRFPCRVQVFPVCKLDSYRLESHATDPMTHLTLTQKVLIPQHGLRSLIQRWRLRHIDV